jgi:Fur family zinc uptake transcriptional regulator
MSEQCIACKRSELALNSLSSHGERLTGLRRDVLKAMHHFNRPVGAYELFDHLKEKGRASAPPAVYRVLDYLTVHDLVHRLPTLSAYTACTAKPHRHDASFLICRGCNNVEEIDDFSFSEVAAASELSNFKLEHVSVSITGLCQRCSQN